MATKHDKASAHRIHRLSAVVAAMPTTSDAPAPAPDGSTGATPSAGGGAPAGGATGAA